VGGFLRIISKNGWNDIFAGRNLLAMRFFLYMYVRTRWQAAGYQRSRNWGRYQLLRLENGGVTVTYKVVA